MERGACRAPLQTNARSRPTSDQDDTAMTSHDHPPYHWQTTDNGTPIGAPLGHLVTPPRPQKKTLEGRYTRLEPLDPVRHASALHRANLTDQDNRIWTYLPYGPFNTEADYRAWTEQMAAEPDPFFYALLDKTTGTPIGILSYLRINPAAGSIEVGHICLPPLAQKTRQATEALILLIRQAFNQGYRRMEWKCDVLNRASRRAAERLGLSFEGVFRQATHYKGRNRDTAWFATTDKDWPHLERAYATWLDPTNFNPDGKQKASLSSLTAPALRLTFADWPLADRLP